MRKGCVLLAAGAEGQKTLASREKGSSNTEGRRDVKSKFGGCGGEHVNSRLIMWFFGLQMATANGWVMLVVRCCGASAVFLGCSEVGMFGIARVLD